MTPHERYMTYMRGWTDGAKCGAINQAFARHENPAFCTVYMKAYEAGKSDRRGAALTAEKISGYKATILRTEDS